VVHPADAFAAFRRAGVVFWAGVPDSLLKDVCRYIEDHAPRTSHVVAANEGGAVAIAAGRHLATGEVCGVYLQNSGLGNTVNPLVSLADPAVYAIPVVLLIGWRGEPGKPDEPQHRRQGEITLELLQTIGVPTRVLPDAADRFVDAVEWAVRTAKERSGPTALVAPAGSFESYDGADKHDSRSAELPAREDALVTIADGLPDEFAIVATTGKTSRELYEHRRRAGGAIREFLTVGSMGHASQIALGIALARPGQRICVFDGDGAAIMHLGSLAVIGEQAPTNLYHVIFNNGAHESVGGQPTPTQRVDFPGLALATGYGRATSVETLDAIAPAVDELIADDGPALLEVRIRQGSRPDLGRPKEAPGESRRRFTAWLER
jgi:phosphonopyruvate decarboxylase